MAIHIQGEEKKKRIHRNIEETDKSNAADESSQTPFISNAEMLYRHHPPRVVAC